ncbi:hypothetical protein UFOVP1670_49 [uncultured Caudovirales phage]|uniref:Uncharacterized protein n=1 Tax=uncultured Caudovirales phage TaxID=2100421 RepID=A0A6J5T6R2_9CAUD|nr:hypothetical protein UFOVP1670_49 [uncultured Caudovirales phage]
MRLGALAYQRSMQRRECLMLFAILLFVVLP